MSLTSHKTVASTVLLLTLTLVPLAHAIVCKGDFRSPKAYPAAMQPTIDKMMANDQQADAENLLPRLSLDPESKTFEMTFFGTHKGTGPYTIEGDRILMNADPTSEKGDVMEGTVNADCSSIELDFGESNKVELLQLKK
ncbi:hypothetical protein [Allohahella marinimesophila]|uniref:Uncharacterized protein n=1 Tax=Allohahella marinimesophila TaxID=1054972 RepID=A0ABP7NJG3_9GAMM